MGVCYSNGKVTWLSIQIPNILDHKQAFKFYYLMCPPLSFDHRNIEIIYQVGSLVIALYPSGIPKIDPLAVKLLENRLYML